MPEQELIQEVWITDGGNRMHLTPDCDALLAGQADARERGRTIHGPYRCPVNLARVSGGYNTAVRERCMTCWTGVRPQAEVDRPELLAEFASRPLLAALAEESKRQAEEEGSKQGLAGRAARSIAEEHGLDDAQEAIARRLIRLNWLVLSDTVDDDVGRTWRR